MPGPGCGALDELYGELSFEEEPRGARPDWLCQVRQQPALPALDVLVPQMMDQPLVLLAAFDVLVPEQVIEVPKMLTPTRCHRTTLSVPQTAEQLVEAPTIVSLIDVIRHLVELIVGGGGSGGLPGFLPGQSYSLSAEQIVDNPIPRSRRGFGGVLHGLHPGQSSTAFGEADHRVPAATAEQTVDIPVLRGAPNDFHQNRLPAAGSSDLPDTANQGFFSTFHRRKKCEDPAHPGVGTGRGLQLMASVSLAGGVADWPRH